MKPHAIRPSLVSLNALIAVLMAVSIAVCAIPVARAATITLNPSKDTTLIETATSDAAQRANGGDAGFYTGQYFDGTHRRALLRFAISGNVPAGSTITSAQLRLNCFSAFEGTSRSHSLYRMLRDWGEGVQGGGIEGGNALPEDACWKYSFFNTTFWGAMGAGLINTDRVSTVSATVSVAGAGVYNLGSTSQMVADVQGWLNTPASNYGWIIIGNETTDNTDRWFDSRESANAGARPQLTIIYTVPGVPPIINDISNSSTLCGTPYTGPTPTLAQGTPTITWTLQAGPSGMTINSSSGVVSWPNPVIAVAPYTITIRATNSFGFDDETWTLNVRPGDFTGDGLVTAADIAPFVGVLVGSTTTNSCASDVNLSGSANGADIQTFVNALLGP